MQKQKSCLFTLMSNNFFIGFETFMKSFLHHNPWFDWDFVILDDQLSPRTKERMTAVYDKIIFKEPHYKFYKGVNFKKTKVSLQTTFYKLDAFSLFDYDRVVQLDMDMICQGDMREVFECEAGFAACKTYRTRGDRLGADFNSGVFVVNKQYLNDDVYKNLVRIASQGYTMPDQKTLNIYFRHHVHFLPKKYNCEKRIIHSDSQKMKIEDMVIIHYVGVKPWQDPKDLVSEREQQAESRYGDVEKLWHEWHDKDVEDDI